MAKSSSARKSQPVIEDAIDTVKIELPIAPGETHYIFEVDDATIESLSRGVCPESLSQRCFGMLDWKREWERVSAGSARAEPKRQT